MTYLVDTNVVSELMRSNADRSVVAWFDAVGASNLFVGSITVAEIALGLELLPDGLKRSVLVRAFDQFLRRGFAGRILAFDELCAGPYAEVVARRRRLGRPIAAFDAQIASIGVANGLTVATRNERDFEDCGVRVVNPFEA